MEMVLLTALGVGGATVVGAVIGFFVRDVDHKTNDVILKWIECYACLVFHLK